MFDKEELSDKSNNVSADSISIDTDKYKNRRTHRKDNVVEFLSKKNNAKNLKNSPSQMEDINGFKIGF